MIEILNKRKTQQGEYIGRPTPLGNPWRESAELSREEVIAKYKKWLDLQWQTGNIRVKAELLRLAKLYRENGELQLLCWCAPKPCHGEVIAEAIENIVVNDLDRGD